jgi:polysaccharide biosynthesis transport protein
MTGNEIEQFVPGQAQPEEFNIMEWVEPILKYRWAVGVIILSTLVLGILYNIKATRIYRAQAGIIIRQNIPTSVIRGKDTELPEASHSEGELNTKIRMISSQPFLEELVKKLINLGHYKNQIADNKYDNMKPGDKAQFIQALANGIKANLEITNPKGTSLVQISYESADPVLAKDVVNQLADIVMDFNKNEQLLILQNSLAYLNQQLEDSKQRVAATEEKLYQYRKEHNIFEADMDKQLMANRRADLRQKLTDLQEQGRETEAKIQQLNNLMVRKDYTKFSPVIAESPTLQDLNQKLVAKQLEYKNQLIKYKPEHPDAKKVAGEVAALQEQFVQELNKTVTKLGFDLNVTRSREKLLQDALTDTDKSAVVSTQNDSGYIVLEREANSARDLYQTLLGAVKEVNVNANSTINNVVYIHEKALVPKRPIKPQQGKNLLISLVLGIMLGAAFAYAREYLDQTIRTPEDVKRIAHLPVLTAVALYNKEKEGLKERPLMVGDHPKSLFSEGVTALRSHLNIKMPQEKPMIIAITSSAPKEGKSLISSNLALSMALSGRRTLIMDTDFHHPNIHKVFEMDQKVGLYDLIVDALNPNWSDLDIASMSFGDIQHMIQLKQWSGTVKLNWNSFPSTLDISYKEGRPAGSNIAEWKEECWKPSRARPSEHISVVLDESEFLDLDGTENSAKKAIEFLSHHPRLIRSIHFSENVIPGYIKHTDHHNLDVLTVGTHPRAPGQILGSAQMQCLLHILKEKYDRIIIDCPPAWPLSDVGVLAPSVDGILWICRVGVASKNMVKHAVHQIQQIQPNILGMVLNAVDYHKDRYYYYGYYGYSSYYYSYYKHYYGDNKDGSEPDEAEQIVEAEDTSQLPPARH